MDKEKNNTAAMLKAINDNTTVIKSMSNMGEELSKLNTMRGGEKGFKGFVAEEMEAARMSAAGTPTRVINDNGPADLVTTGNNGHQYLKQVKNGYKPGQIDFSKYKGQEVIIDKGNPYFDELAKEARQQGVRLTEGTVSSSESQVIADAMQLETKITGAKSATVVPRVAAAHEAGLSAGKTGAMFGAGFSIGTNMIDVVEGKKNIGEAAVDVAKDTAISYGVGYAAGAAGSVIAETTVGAHAIAAAGGIGSAITGTTVGGAVAGAVGTAGAAVSTAATAGTAAVMGAVGLTGTAVAAAAPLVAVGALIGVGVKLIDSILGTDDDDDDDEDDYDDDDDDDEDDYDDDDDDDEDDYDDDDDEDDYDDDDDDEDDYDDDDDDEDDYDDDDDDEDDYDDDDDDEDDYDDDDDDDEDDYDDDDDDD